jgi:Ca2+-transporting ATPase
MVTIVIAQIFIIQYGGAVFETVPLSLEQWAKIIIVSASVLVVGFFLRVAFRYPAAKKNNMIT